MLDSHLQNEYFIIILNKEVFEMYKDILLEIVNIGVDFFQFWKETKNLSSERRMEIWRERYVEKHREIISALNEFRFFSEEYFMQLLKSGAYAKRIKRMEHVAEGLPRKISELTFKAISNLNLEELKLTAFIIVGTFNFDGATIPYRGRGAVGLGLEVICNYPRKIISILLAHEIGHAIHLNTYCRFNKIPICIEFMDKIIYNIGRSLYLEGLAVASSMRIIPNRNENEYLFYSREEMNWCRENRKNLISRMLKLVDLTDEDTYIKYFTGNAKPEDIPYRRIAYYVGSIVINKLLENYDLNELYKVRVEEWGKYVKKTLIELSK